MFLLLMFLLSVCLDICRCCYCIFHGSCCYYYRWCCYSRHCRLCPVHVCVCTGLPLLPPYTSGVWMSFILLWTVLLHKHLIIYTFRELTSWFSPLKSCAWFGWSWGFIRSDTTLMPLYSHVLLIPYLFPTNFAFGLPSVPGVLQLLLTLP